MVQKETKLYVADNCGARAVTCISVIKRKVASFGDFILVVLYIFRKDKRLVKKKKYLGLLISVTRARVRPNAITISFTRNRLILFIDRNKFAGTRIYGPLFKELKSKRLFNRFKNLVSYAHRIY